MKKITLKLLASVLCLVLLLCSCGTADQTDSGATTTVGDTDTVTTTVSGDADSTATTTAPNGDGVVTPTTGNGGAAGNNSGNGNGNTVTTTTVAASSAITEKWPAPCTKPHVYNAELQVAAALKSGTVGARDAVYYKSCTKCGTPSKSQNDLFAPHVIELDLSELAKNPECCSIINMIRGKYKGKTVVFSFNYYYDVPAGTAPVTLGLLTDNLQAMAYQTFGTIRKTATASVAAKMTGNDLYVQIGGDGKNGSQKLPSVNGSLYIWDLQVHVDGKLANRFDIDGDAYTAAVKSGYANDSGWFQGDSMGVALADFGEFFAVPRPVVGASGKYTPTACKFLLMSDIHIEDDFKHSTAGDGSTDMYICWSPDHRALTKTYEYINQNFKDLQFALFTGDIINEGYSYAADNMRIQMKNYWSTIQSLDIYKNTAGKDLSAFKLTRSASTLGYGPKDMHSAVINMQGNHDHDARDFYRDCSFIVNKVKFVTFFPTYKGVNGGSTGVISDASVEFIKQEFAKAAGEGIEHLVLVCHYAICEGKDVTDGFGPDSIIDKADGNNNDNRQKVLDLCKQYGCMLYLSGHAHSKLWTVGTALNKDGTATNVKNVSLGTATEQWSIAEIKNNKLTLQVYSTAQSDYFSGEFTSLPQQLKTVTVDLIPRSQLVSGK